MCVCALPKIETSATFSIYLNRAHYKAAQTKVQHAPLYAILALVHYGRIHSLPFDLLHVLIATN